MLRLMQRTAGKSIMKTNDLYQKHLQNMQAKTTEKRKTKMTPMKQDHDHEDDDDLAGALLA